MRARREVFTFWRVRVLAVALLRASVLLTSLLPREALSAPARVEERGLEGARLADVEAPGAAPPAAEREQTIEQMDLEKKRRMAEEAARKAGKVPPREVPEAPPQRQPIQQSNGAPVTRLLEPSEAKLVSKYSSLPVGELNPELHQIAVRGPLIAVASNTSSDEKVQGGVRLIDGKTWQERLFVPVPAGARTLGVALDTDSLVYAVNPQSSPAFIVRLGLEGAYRWVRQISSASAAAPDSVGSAVTAPMLISGAAGERDVVVTLQHTGPPKLSIVRLDGATGSVLWLSPLDECVQDVRLYAGELDAVPGADLIFWCRTGNGLGRLGSLGVDGQSLAVTVAPFSAAPLAVRLNSQVADFLGTRGAIVGNVSESALWAARKGPGPEDLLAQKPFSGALIDPPSGGPCLFMARGERSVDTERVLLTCQHSRVRNPSDADWAASSPGNPNESFRLDGTNYSVNALAFSVDGSLDQTAPDRKALILNEGKLIQVEWAGGIPRASSQSLRGAKWTTASLGNVDGDARWDLLVAMDDQLFVFDTMLEGRARSRFPFGDTSATRVHPDWFDEPVAEARRVGPLDSATFAHRIHDASPSFETIAESSLERLHEIEAEGGVVFAFREDLEAPKFADGPPSTRAGTLELDSAAFSHPDIAIELRKPGQGLAVERWLDRSDAAVLKKLQRAILDCRKGRTTMPCPQRGAVSPEKNWMWGAFDDGVVRAYTLTEPPGLARTLAEVTGGPVRLLRAFPDRLAVGRDTELVLYDVSGEPRPLHSARLTADELELCGETWYALSDGKLYQASEDFVFRPVVGQPERIRAILCDSTGDLYGVALRMGAFRVRAPPAPVSWLTLLCTIGLGSLGGVAFVAARFRKRPDGSGPHISKKRVKTGSVVPPAPATLDHSLKVDTPLVEISRASDNQRILVEALKAFLDNEKTLPPLTVGIYGAWGSGKSSVMRLLDAELAATGRYITVWFNAWRHQQEEHLGPALLQSLVEKFRREASPRVHLRAWLSSIATHRRILYGLAATITFLLFSAATFVAYPKAALLTFVSALLPFWKSVGEPLWKLFTIEPAQAADAQLSKRLGFLQEFSQEFERVVGLLPENHFVAVFVDDLDRCPPDRVVDVLEALNRLMESQHCFVILGIDDEMVQHCVELRYEQLIKLLAQPKPGRSFGTDFLEKLVTLAVRVPAVGLEEMTTRAAEPGRPPITRLQHVIKWAVRNSGQVAILSGLVGVLSISGYWWVYYPDEVKARVRDAAGWIGVEVEAEKPAATPPETDQPASAPAPTAEVPTVASAPPPPAPVASPAPQRANPAPPKPTSASKPADLATEPRVLSAPPAAAPPAPRAIPDPNTPSTSLEEAQDRAKRLQFLSWFSLLALGGITGLVLFLFAMDELLLKWREPPATDSEVFAKGLTAQADRLPTNPRQLVRFENLARLAFRILLKCKASRPPGWETTFFEYLTARQRQEDYNPPPQHAWVVEELRPWLDRVRS